MIFDQKNQQFRTVDFLAFVVLIATVGSSIGAVIAETFQDDSLPRAKAMAESFARQLEYQRLAAISTQMRSAREPASEIPQIHMLTDGEIGRDPWGNPYHYRVLEPNGDEAHKIFVWSSGPNGRSESNDKIVKGFGGESQSPFGGDDLGYIREFYANL